MADKPFATEGQNAGADAPGEPAGGGEGNSVAQDMTVSPRRAVRRARWAELVFVSALAVYAVLALLAYRYAYFEWDLVVSRRIQSIDVPGFYEFMAGVSWLGSGLTPSVMVVATGLLLIAAKFRIEGVICMFGVGIGNLVNHLVKSLIGRPRPDASLVEIMTRVNHESFPSGHVTFFIEYFGFMFFLAYVLLRRGAARRASLIILGLLIALVGVSRIYLGAHWASDVVGAYLAGSAWLLLMIEVYRRLKAKQEYQP
jgi:undecaprenyl-diphosphatase